MEKSTAASIGSGMWKGTKAAGSATWKAGKATAAATAEAVDSAKERKAEAAAKELEAKHRAEFASKSKARQSAAAKAAGGGDGGASSLYAKHAGAVRSTNDFGLSDKAASAVRGEQPAPEPEPSTFGAKLGGMFAKKATAAPSERDQLLELAKAVGWDEDMLSATIDGLDGDLAQTRALLEQQKAAS